MILHTVMRFLVHLKVVINFAMSADGKIALKSRRQTAISDEADKKRVHELRNRSDAILVGIGTVLSDDPKLTVNEKYVERTKNPLRIVLDSRGRMPSGALVLNGAAPTLVVTSEECSKSFPNTETIRCGKGEVDLGRLLEILEERGIQSLLVEGGSRVIWSFLEKRLADEVHMYIGSMVIGGDSAPTPAGGEGAADEGEIVALTLKSCEAIGEGILLKYQVTR